MCVCATVHSPKLNNELFVDRTYADMVLEDQPSLAERERERLKEKRGRERERAETNTDTVYVSANM